MMTASSRRSTGPVIRSLSPSGRFCNSSNASSSAFASSRSSFSSRSTTFLHRSVTPTRMSIRDSVQSVPSVRFSLDSPISPGRTISVSTRSQVVKEPAGGGSSSRPSIQKRTCMCSPTTHPGSFRCSLHKNFNNNNSGNRKTVSYNSNRLNARRSAMTNSLVRIGTVEGDLVKRALAALIRPSSHQQRRQAAFQPRPSRLSNMSKANDL